MDQRTRFLGGRAGRIILLGDGTEILTGQVHDDDGDIDMEDRGEAEEAEEDDLNEQVQKGEESNKPNGEAIDAERSKREETPSPANADSDDRVEDTKQQQPANPERETKAAAATDGADSKTGTEKKDKK